MVIKANKGEKKQAAGLKKNTLAAIRFHNAFLLLLPDAHSTPSCHICYSVLFVRMVSLTEEMSTNYKRGTEERKFRDGCHLEGIPTSFYITGLKYKVACNEQSDPRSFLSTVGPSCF
jgi:hypothetical protein